MIKLASIAIISSLISINACGNKQIESAKNESLPDTTIAPVETKSPNSNYKPAFPGQTRINGTKTKSAYTFKVLSEKLNSPWGIASLPDGRLIITEKAGFLRISTTSGVLSNKITGLPKVDENGQGGLLGIAVDPDFAKNRKIYWAFSENTGNGNHTAVAKGTLSADETKIENSTVIFRSNPTYRGNLHFGGRLIFDPKGNLVLGTGERSDTKTRPMAQDNTTALGKIIKITTEGQPAQGNPFVNHNDYKKEIFSYGHRNVQGLSINPVTGELWSNEFGPRGGDEINRVEAGKNYGWPTITYGIEYSGSKVGEAIQQKSGLEQPVYYWDPVVSPSGMTFYNKGQISEWNNNLFVGCLSGMHIARLIIKDNKVIGEERLLDQEYQRFRDVHQGKDGAIYAVTDQGRLYYIGK
ncbi:MAG: PQQ-dependent sugar dehydrogenase [Cytophagaceae bacterium]|nr:PQQ-dependent sugar dehydrogenase [Cytophagaceae bacterium]MBK9934183.1 PQQ-dependent sugar dehydrogenase [Cytophagaceae bacterium]MBL0300632.1 PQQ-dependent sugar dehydrogenase [Cytophagaceae bacterium]MBL0327575.1 PQQ-dependent sugar dehydrogenase [Cytophagaceae bacterium]